jgi:threonine dehydratase
VLAGRSPADRRVPRSAVHCRGSFRCRRPSRVRHAGRPQRGTSCYRGAGGVFTASDPILTPPAFADVLEARRRIRPHLDPTPLLAAPALGELLGPGTEVWLKLEFLSPIRAFKVRGGVNLAAAERERGSVPPEGMVAASTGNHGQSVAYAGHLFGIPVRVFVPERANTVKTRSMERLGATVVRTGRDFDEAREAAEQFARRHAARYVHSMNEPLLIAGVATAYLEALEARPDADVLFVPMGGGSGASGAGLVAKTLRPATRVIAVQAEGAPALHNAYHSGVLEHTASVQTAAEGLATRVAFSLPLTMIRCYVDEVALVSDSDLYAAQALFLEHAGLLPEMAGAAGLAAALHMKDRLAGQRVILTLTGANVSRPELLQVLKRVGAP